MMISVAMFSRRKELSDVLTNLDALRSLGKPSPRSISGKEK